MKISTSKKISLQLSTISFALVLILLIMLSLHFGKSWFLFIFSSILTYIILCLFFIISFAIFNIIINKFLYEKLKVIYKNIYKYKRATSIIDFNLDNVDMEVSQWANQRMLEIDKEKSSEKFRREFLGNVSHELKTPIFNIQGYVQTLIDGALEDKEVNLKYLERTNKSVDRMIAIVQDLGIITKLESEENEINISKNNLEHLVLEAFEHLELKANKRNIKLLQINSPSTPFVECDSRKITQVLINLITNAIKYGKDNGKVEIRYYDMGENLLIEIADNGLGIKKKHLARLFERFYRVDKNRSREIGGTGLGLAIVKHIIEAHKQTINVRSTFGEGSTFSFTLKKIT